MNRMLTTKEWQESLAEAFHKAVKSACQDLIDEAVKAEREACAKVCDQYDDDGGAGETWGPRFADAIRARGADE